MSEVKEGHKSVGMAEKVSEATSQGRKENNEGETQSSGTNNDESRENADNDLSQKQQHTVTAATASSSESANPDIKNGNDSTIQNNDSTKNEEKDKSKECSNTDSKLTMEEKSPLSQVNAENHGDGKEKSPKKENLSTIEKAKSENNEGKTQSTGTNHDKSCENADNDLSQKQQHTVTAATASSSESAKTDIKNGNDSTIQNNDSTKNEEKDKSEEACSPNTDSKLMETKIQPSQANVSDGKQDSLKNKKPEPKNEPKSDKGYTMKQEAPKTTTSPILEVKTDDRGDGPKSKLDEEIPHTNDTHAESGDALEESTPLAQITSMKQQLDEHSDAVETIGPTPPEATQPAVPENTGGMTRLYLLLAAVIVVVFAILVQHFIQQESPPQKNDLRQIDIFLRQLEKVKTQFPNQRAELWSRSRIHLKRHLQNAQPTEPVSLILTGGLRAESTMICLAKSLAVAFSSALNATYLRIDGNSTASQDSDQVKLDIDRKLQGAFEGGKPVAIIHRFEELPPGSTLIFYRYCDHENAAYKNTFLIFTVLLGEEDEIPAKISLNAVEEMVDDHLKKKFLSHGQPVSFDMMDLDKYGGLWSRISHLILPVATEKRVELEGC